jgi:hypothetical protein
MWAVKPIETRSFDDTPNLIEACGLALSRRLKSSGMARRTGLDMGHVACQCGKWMLTTATGDGMQVFVNTNLMH